MDILDEIENLKESKREWARRRDRLQRAYNDIKTPKDGVSDIEKKVGDLLDDADWEGNTKDEFKSKIKEAKSAVSGYWKNVDAAHDTINRERRHADSQSEYFDLLLFRKIAATEMENIIN